MLSLWLDYPSFEEEINIVKNTTSDQKISLRKILSNEEILFYQDLVRRIPVPQNVLEHAVRLATKTRPGSPMSSSLVKDYLTWGAGPRASQNLVIGAKCHALIRGKYAPDREDVDAVAQGVLRHRIVRNYKAEADGYSVESIIEKLVSEA
jgi:MoxR-like ATPase